MAYTYQNIDAEKLVGEERAKRIAAEEETFWKYDYNYLSSIASVIHAKLKRECNVLGIEKTPEERTEPEKVFFREMEHRRWNAYVRSEGFVYNKKREKLAKTHHLLIPFADLPFEEQIKDDN